MEITNTEVEMEFDEILPTTRRCQDVYIEKFATLESTSDWAISSDAAQVSGYQIGAFWKDPLFPPLTGFVLNKD